MTMSIRDIGSCRGGLCDDNHDDDDDVDGNDNHGDDDDGGDAVYECMAKVIGSCKGNPGYCDQDYGDDNSNHDDNDCGDWMMMRTLYLPCRSALVREALRTRWRR